MPVTFNNTTFSAVQSQLGATVFGGFVGSDALSGTTPVTINGTIDQPGSVVSVDLNIAGITQAGAQGTYVGFAPADQNGNFTYYFNVTTADLQTPVTLAVTNAPVLSTVALTPINTSNVSAPVCFVTGTRIRTVAGEVAVEALTVGDLVVTASGEHRPIVWIGRREMNLVSRREAQPVRICAGALEPNVPVRDLLVSPGHRLLIEGMLVCAVDLINGYSILREQAGCVTYWHVELESHDIVLAEGVPAESYVEAANRTAFDNGEVVFGNRPRTSLTPTQPLCAPLAERGPKLDALITRLHARTHRSGNQSVSDPSIQLVVDGLVLTPVAVAEGRFEYVLPNEAGHIILRSRSAVPMKLWERISDVRRLGICVTAISIDGEDIAMDDPRLVVGWHEPENEGAFRWTTGEAYVPVGRRLAITATPLPTYVTEPEYPKRHSVAS